MPLDLDAQEQRVLGCLLEKAVLTPDQYPLTLNSLVNACNQKSSRAPVMQLEPGEVQGTLRRLQDQHLVRADENFKSRVEKFTHRFCNTPFSDYQFDSAQYAVVTVLLLRGSRTPGEIRANSGRLHEFADNGEVEATLRSLIDIEKGPLVAMLARTPGRRDAEWVHLFGGVPEAVEFSSATSAGVVTTTAFSAESASSHAPSTGSSAGSSPSEGEDIDQQGILKRVEALEEEVAELRRMLLSLSS